MKTIAAFVLLVMFRDIVFVKYEGGYFPILPCLDCFTRDQENRIDYLKDSLNHSGSVADTVRIRIGGWTLR
jgi:hypothetical protein